MPSISEFAQNPNYRIQGTDGVRRETALSSNPIVAGLSPLQAFQEKGIITEEFMELYVYAHVKIQLEKRKNKNIESFVVGWDPRDPNENFTESVVRGIRKAGANALALGVVPTPLVPMYSLYKNAAGGFMITASHNPKDQNGIKTFLAYQGMKLLPENDIELTQAITNLGSIKKLPIKGQRLDRRREALDLFTAFSLSPENSWAQDCSFKNICLVVDPARGSLSGLAAQIFRQAGFGKVIEVNNSLGGDVNLNSGVGDLEGYTFVSSQTIEKGVGIFSKYVAIRKIFELGRRNQEKISQGKLQVCGAVFDADGDRFYRLDYHPGKDGLIVSSGDETAFLQAKFLMKQNSKKYQKSAYINTVESDLNAGIGAEKLGFNHQLSAVGDKWISLRLALIILENQISSLDERKRKKLKKPFDALKKSTTFNVEQFECLEKEIEKLKTPSEENAENHSLNIPFAVGSEETGHNITIGWMKTENGQSIPVFYGNGLKSALNTFSATQTLLSSLETKKYFSQVEHPFTAGFKETLYVYYVKKELFYNKSKVWNRIKKLINKLTKALEYNCKIETFREDLDMLYFSLSDSSNSRAGIFIRNSGTENKISVNLRGSRKNKKDLIQIGEEAIRLLFLNMKDESNPFYSIEKDLVNKIKSNPLPEDKVEEASSKRVLMEMRKQGLIQPSAQGFRFTDRGNWYASLK